MSLFDKVLKVGEGKKIRRLTELVPLINALEPEMEKLDDASLQHKTVEFRERLDNGETLEDILLEAFALVREAAWRTIGERHFDVQLMGGMALHFGWIAEMKTGEGKTLVSTLPAYLNGLNSKGVHLVTVNDYLAKRDSAWMGQIHKWLGLSVGVVVSGMENTALRKKAYACDITYGTNTEFGFDYLRDNMAYSKDQMTQRQHVYAIVDEVDSILIDEARTPLIISGPSTQTAKFYHQFASIVRTLKRDVDYEVDEEKRTVTPTESGIAVVEKGLGINNLYDQVAINYVHHLEQALKAKELYLRDKDYVVLDGEIKIVDEFTGRILEGRRWSDGLHQAVEAKERVPIKEENHTWATVTLQNYFRLYQKLSGMTGTAETESAEFASTYNLPVVAIPTNKPMVRRDLPDYIYKSEEAKFRAVVQDIKACYEKGQPVLVGTASVEKSEYLSMLLDKEGIPHSVLNAKQNDKEALIVAQAGRLHSVTVATNMAGRGVDILLGGNWEGLAVAELLEKGIDPQTEEGVKLLAKLKENFVQQCKEEGDMVRELGGLYVLGTERHEARRIDNQLRGRSGRQGDVGKSRFYLSLEDELMRIFATGAMTWVMNKAIPEDIPIEVRLISRAIEKAQHTVESINAERRKDVLKYDEVMDKQRKVIYAKRMQIIEGEDLKEYTEELLEKTIISLVQQACPREYKEEWDIHYLLTEVSQYYPTQFSPDELFEATGTAQLTDSLIAECLSYYHQREEAIPAGKEAFRQLERELMLQIIDQHWQDHLAEMDYLREGINLRAMGQQDPLVAWQKDGFEMFGKLMDVIDDDYLRYIMHVEVITQPSEAVDFAQAQYLAADNPVEELGDILQQLSVGVGTDSNTNAQALGTVGFDGAGTGGALDGRTVGNGATRTVGVGAIASGTATRVSASRKKIGRNDPCWCGSNKKYKLCHGSQI